MIQTWQEPTTRWKMEALYGRVGDWDVSQVTDFSNAFKHDTWKACTFNEDIGRWDTSSGVTFTHMFSGCQWFNQDIREWDTSSAESMNYMFAYARRFNQNIGKWNAEKVTNFNAMFGSDISQNFYQNLCQWTNVPDDVVNMFRNGNGLIGSCASDYDGTLRDLVTAWYADQTTIEAEYGKISIWDVSKVTIFTEAFAGETTFNEDISEWDTTSATHMDNMFRQNSVFNQDL